MNITGLYFSGTGALFLFFLVLLRPENSSCWRHDRRSEINWIPFSDSRPRLYGNRMPKSLLTTDLKKVQGKIVSYHNYFRTNVRPSAANMLEMNWHSGAARAAQSWSDQCQLLSHDSASDRWTDLYGPCGQNIFVSTHKVPWFFAIKTWNLEYMNFTYGSPRNILSVVGHYTQMVWASSHKVGCGFTQCRTSRGKTFYNYICNYCPIGNYVKALGKPYKRGTPCSDCPDSCSHSTSLCTNACPFADLWVNCPELSHEWNDWLCRDKSKEGHRRRKHCRATCHCRNKIVPRYSYFK